MHEGYSTWREPADIRGGAKINHFHVYLSNGRLPLLQVLGRLNADQPRQRKEK